KMAIRSVAVPAHLASLPAFPLFLQLGRAAFLAVAAQAKLRNARKDETIVTEGDDGAAMFAIVHGAVKVVRDGADGEQQLARMDDGAFFGEMALLAQSPRLATVKADEDTQLLEFTREAMDDVIRRHPTVGKAV